MDVFTLTCPYCGAVNTVTLCRGCSRYFVITEAHLKHQSREFEARAVSQVPGDFQVPECDFCRLRGAGSVTQRVIAGVRQGTCPSCRVGFLPQYRR